MVSLLDLNVLVALLVPEHEHHVLAQEWFAKEAAAHGWATSAVTELGVIRVCAQLPGGAWPRAVVRSGAAALEIPVRRRDKPKSMMLPSGDSVVVATPPGRTPCCGRVYPAQWRCMTLTDRIEVDPRVMLGNPVIRGTRIGVELILRKLSEGASMVDLLDAYPHLTRDDICEALRYAAGTLAHEEVIFIGRESADDRD